MTIRIVCDSRKRHAKGQVAILGDARRLPDDDRYWGEIEFALPPWEILSGGGSAAQRREMAAFKKETGTTGLAAWRRWQELKGTLPFDTAPPMIVGWTILPDGRYVDHDSREADDYALTQPRESPPLRPVKYELRCRFCGDNVQRKARDLYDLLDAWESVGRSELSIATIRSHRP